MPYRRRSYRRRGGRRGRRTPWYNKKYSTAQIARAAWRSAKYIRGLVNSEMYHYDQTLTLGANSSYVHPVANIAQGDTAVTRTGNSLLAKSLNINGYAIIHSSVTSNTRIMIALVLDKQQVADTKPAVTDIFSVDNPQAFLNTDNAGRFTILKRMQITLFPTSTGTGNARVIKFFKNFNFHVRYNGTASTDIAKNGLYLVMTTSEGTNFPTISLNSRFSYHDN